MSNPTTPFGWQMPTATDLVTDLPADFEVFGQAVATSMSDLLGGTTGQVLKKNTNADMDFVWGADSAGMTNPMTTTGDTIYSSPGSTPVRLPIGSAGQVLGITAGVPAWTTPASGLTSANNYVNAFEGTTSATYTAITTAQAVTVTTGTKVLVLIGCTMENDSGVGRGARMSYAISGATTTAASDNWSVGVDKFYSDGVMQSATKHSYQTVTAGSNTFTAQFKRVNGAGQANFHQRYITVIDLGS